MAFLHIPAVSLKGIAACVPSESTQTREYSGFNIEDAEKFIASTGIERRRVARELICTSDLCHAAAEKLINELSWEKEDIDCLIFVSQTPDYKIPPTSCMLQSRLGLKGDLFTLDISSGCTGWIFGLKVISSLMSHGSYKKGLLLVGDTISKYCSPEDRSTYPLFGDAGTATTLEYDSGAEGFKFHSAADGAGYKAIIIPDGACRNPFTCESLEVKDIEPGIRRNNLHIALDGMNVFSFGITSAPDSINKLSEQFHIGQDNVDYLVLHQANLFLNEKIRKKVKFPVEKVPCSLRNFGNTSSATIPLTICTELRDKISTGKCRFIGCGFGVGLTWGSVYFETDRIICPNLIEI